MRIGALPIHPSAPHTHTHTVVFLHGRGDNAKNFSSSLDYSRDSLNRSLTEAFPTVRWVFPQAPLRKCASLPDSVFQWFDVWDVRDFSAREELQAEGLREVVPAIHLMLSDEAHRLGGRWDRIILAGISMGAATAAHLLMNLNVPAEGGGRLSAFMGFSCRCPFVGRTLAEMRALLGVTCYGIAPTGDEVIKGTPVFLEHCVDDPLVLIENGRKMRDTLSGFGATVEWKEYRTGGHWFNAPEGIDDAVQFLRGIIQGREPKDGEVASADANAMDLT